jgi:hypothetical protein
LSVDGDPEIVVRVLGAAAERPMQLDIEADRTRDFTLYLTLPERAIDGPREAITFRVTDPVTGETATTPSVLVTGAE